MTELDFVTFGIKPNNQKLLRRIYEAVSELRAFGDLELRSAWLYYGSISAASRTLGIPASTYRTLVRPQRMLSMDTILMTNNLGIRWKYMRKHHMREPQRFRKITAFQRISYSERWMIADGAYMIMELPDDERAGFLSITRPLPTSGENYIKKVELWKKVQGKRPVAKAEELLEAYILIWYLRRNVRIFFRCGGIEPSLKKALECRSEIETTANTSKICSVALEIFHEYDIYCKHWEETRRHIEIQRRLMNSKQRRKFLAELEKRYGLICAACGSAEDLRIDHIKAVSRGGFSSLENLQLLCNSCNSDKGTNEEDYRLCETAT